MTLSNQQGLGAFLALGTLLRVWALAEALATMQNTGERWWEAELYRLKGKLLLTQAAEKGGSRMALTETAPAAAVDIGERGRPSLLLETETCLLQALEIARRQQAKSLELRAR